MRCMLKFKNDYFFQGLAKMILISHGNNGEELYQRWLDLQEVIPAVLAQAENEMFFADFL